MSKSFSFVLDSFQITDTRSLHNDTDFVTFTLAVNPSRAGQPLTVTKAMGDVNNGIHTVNLSFANIQVNPTDIVTLNYIILNNGHNSPSQIVTALENAGVKLLTDLGTELGKDLGSLLDIPPSVSGPLGGDFFKWLAGKLLGIIFANCDGPVAAEQVSFTFNDLVAKTANGPFTRTTQHKGTNSPTGCGSNSVYSVNWHIVDPSVVVPVPNVKVPLVLEGSDTSAAKAIRAVGLVPAFKGSGHLVIRQDPAAGTMVFKGSTVTLTLTKLAAQ